ncbi:MAG: type 4a pilus biogenesis protein PilO [Candidatus Omnitrophota bacterium]|nr:type 4a pilus biogenesis protein PilO [Candidatus Omnitrophota bacterium]
MKKLSIEQKKNIYIAAAAVSFFLLFWIFIYAPELRRLNALEAELRAADSGIQEITDMAAGRELTQAARDFNQELNRERAKFIFKEEEDVINSLSALAKDAKISITNMDPSQARMLQGKVGGYDVRELPVRLDISGDFASIGGFLEGLRNKYPGLVRINQIAIKGRGPGQTELGAVLQVTAYII